MTCTACKTTEHPREAHSDPALARAEAERLVAAGRRVEAEMWRRVACNLGKSARLLKTQLRLVPREGT